MSSEQSLKPTGSQLAAGGLLLGLYLLLRKPESDTIEQGEALTITPQPAVPPFIMWEQGQAPAPTTTPGTLRVDLSLSVSSLLIGVALPRAKEAVTPAKLRSLIAYMKKNCPSLPAVRGDATAQVAAGGPGIIISVKVPVNFVTQPDNALKACIERALRQSSSDINERFASLTVRAEK